MIFKFPIADGALPLWLSCTATSESDVWQVNDIAIFQDDSYSLPSLVAELQFVRLPPATQAQLREWIERDYQTRRFHANAMRAHDLMVSAMVAS